jgi:nucleoside-diphosphate-sugar epimerase
MRSGTPVVAFDLAQDLHRLTMLASDAELEKVTFVRGDITDPRSIGDALDTHEITNVVHLAALQVPACRAQPTLGALVNVVGTVNLFEAVRQRSDRIHHLVYAGSVGMFAASDADPATGRLEGNAEPHPMNHYGVYKQANEGTARVYWREHGISSIGLRPMTVYGPGRDQGLTSSPTKAIAAALLGQRYTIGFGGRTLFQHAEDVASALLVASRAQGAGARVFNLGGRHASVEEFVSAIDTMIPGARDLIRITPDPLPFPDEISDEGLASLGTISIKPLADGIENTARIFEALLAGGVAGARDFGIDGQPGAGR